LACRTPRPRLFFATIARAPAGASIRGGASSPECSRASVQLMTSETFSSWRHVFRRFSIQQLRVVADRFSMNPLHQCCEGFSTSGIFVAIAQGLGAHARHGTIFVNRGSGRALAMEFSSGCAILNPYVPVLQGRLHLLLFRSSSSNWQWGPRSTGDKPW